VVPELSARKEENAMPILDPKHDYAHPVEKNDFRWSESYYFNGYCPRTDTGLLGRIGIRPNEGRVEGFIGIWPQGGGVVCVDASGSTDGMFDTVLEVGGLRFTMEEPMTRWRLEGEGTSRDGKHVRLDARFTALTPAIGVDGQGRNVEGAKAIAMSTIASGHLEQAGAWTGTAGIDGVLFTLDGGRGNRDKSWGSREPTGERAGLEMWRWFSINVGDDIHFGGIRLGTAAGDIHRGWVWRGGRSGSIRRWSLDTVVGDDGMTPRSLDAVITDKEGREHKLHGEIIRVWNMAHDETMAIQECLTRFTLAGVGTGYGISEYMHRLDGSGRPARRVE
jgi:hypothetical protein